MTLLEKSPPDQAVSIGSRSSTAQRSPTIAAEVLK
jgi:hypothetical protein